MRSNMGLSLAPMHVLNDRTVYSVTHNVVRDDKSSKTPTGKAVISFLRRDLRYHVVRDREQPYKNTRQV